MYKQSDNNEHKEQNNIKNEENKSKQKRNDYKIMKVIKQHSVPLPRHQLSTCNFSRPLFARNFIFIEN